MTYFDNPTGLVTIMKAENGFIVNYRETLPITDGEMPDFGSIGIPKAAMGAIMQMGSLASGQQVGRTREVMKVFLTLDEVVSFLHAHYTVTSL